MLLSEIDTPALLIDLKLLEKNIETMAEFYRSKKGKNNRSHFKCPKSPIIAWKEIRAGANGITCQKLGEAEVLVLSGINDVLISNEIVGDYKVKKMIGIKKHAPGLMVCVDNLINAKNISREALRKNVKMHVLVDVNIGKNRCGVLPEHAVELATQVSKLKGLEFKGIQAYLGGSVHTMDQREGMEAKLKTLNAAKTLTFETKDAIEAAGLNVEIASGAGTGTYKYMYEALTETQAGTYALMDWRIHRSVPEFKRALTVLTTVMSTPSKERAIVDAGGKSIKDAHLKDVTGVTYGGGGVEHGVLKLEKPSKEINLGDKLELYPSHADTTVNLYDKYYGIRDGEVEVVWPIYARGKSQ